PGVRRAATADFSIPPLRYLESPLRTFKCTRHIPAPNTGSSRPRPAIMTNAGSNARIRIALSAGNHAGRDREYAYDSQGPANLQNPVYSISSVMNIKSQ